MRFPIASRSWLRACLALVIVAVVLAAGRPAHAGGIVYVVPGGSGAKDGSSWANARGLAAALSAASSGDELWVKKGTYKPSTTGLTDPRTATFALKTGVAVYGGFAGTETQRDGRNWQTNVTTLSGDIGVAGDNSDNTSNVVTASGTDSSAVLDGFTITGGNAARSTCGCVSGIGGGGVFVDSAAATFSNLIVTGNSAYANGGGVLSWNASPTFTNVTLSNNVADSGGGMSINFVNGSSQSPKLTNVTFDSNGSPTTNSGGGLYIIQSSPSLTNVTFKLNEAVIGGGLYSTTQSAPTLTNAMFISNQASYEGGGLASQDFSTPTLYNAVFIANYGGSGGGVSSESSQVNLVNATFNANISDRGGAVYTKNLSNVATAVPTLTSSILWGDVTWPSTPSEIYNAAGSASASYSIVQGGYTGTGNIDGNPKFISPVDPSTGITTNANLRLGSGSAAVNAGDPNAAIPPLPAGDLDGKPRIVGAKVDMGAYEALCPSDTPTTLYVNAAVSGGLGNGESWANASPTLAFALARAQACSTVTQIWVAKGTYKPDPTGHTSSRNASFTLKSGLAIYGGFAGNETSLGQRNANPATNGTVLSGDLLGNDTGSRNTTAEDNAYHVVTAFQGVDATAILDGFTIRAGWANSTNATCFYGSDTPELPPPCGGGIYQDRASATYSNLIITDNYASWYGGAFGGGVFANQSNSTFTNVTVSNNNASSPVAEGGGMYFSNGAPTLTNVTFFSNKSSSHGGGLALDGSEATLTNVTFKLNQGVSGGGLWITNPSYPKLTNVAFIDNQATYGGGGLYSENVSKPTLVNAVFMGNYGRYGGGVAADGSQVNITNATFNGNLAEQGGAVYSDNYGDTILTNSIIWGDGAVRPEVPLVEIYNVGGGQTSVNYSIVQGGYPGTGNLNSDPKLLSMVDPQTGDTTHANMRLDPTSPAINAGDPNAAIPPLPSTDLDGKPRIVGPRIDMGAYEVQDTTPPDTSLSTTPANPSGANVSFTFSGSDDITPGASLTFQCSLDNAAFTTCASPQAYNGLSDGSHTFKVRAVDAANNADPSPASFTWTVDATPPTVSRNSAADGCTMPGTNGWCRGTQTAGFSASDASSGVAGPCSGASCNFTQSTTTNGSSVSIASGQACDAAGNCAPGINAGPFKIDSVAPTASVTSPANGANYVVGAAVVANYGCADTGGSGVATCSGPVASGRAIDTATPGAKTFNVTVTDNAGNSNSVQVSYTVGYTVVYISPTVGPPSVNNVSTIGRGPWYTLAMWRLSSASGMPVAPGLVSAVRYTPMTCGAALPAYSDGYPSASGAIIPVPKPEVYQGPWVFGWQTPTTKGCYALYARYANGVVVPFLYRLN